jgi:apolipoprotein N-acyltransferase
VLGVADYFAPGDHTLTVQVPVGGVRTLYARTGDLFAWLCVAGLVTALAMAIPALRIEQRFSASRADARVAASR